MGNNITSLYVNETSIRLMVTRGKRIIKLAEVPLDPETAGTTQQEKEEHLVSKIKYLCKSNKIGAGKIMLGLSGLRCLTRPLVLPELPKAMLDEAVIREARRVLPVPVEQLYIAWQVVSVEAGKLQAFMVAIPRQIADSLVKTLHQAGFKPYVMEIKPLSLARLAKEDTAIIVDVQIREFDIIIMVGGLPQPIRTVAFPEEETLTLPDRLAIIKDELRRTVEFYNTNNTSKQIQPGASVLVSGELAEEQALLDSLSSELGYKVSPLLSPLKCHKQLDPSRHLMNVGMTLKEMPREAGPLLPNFNSLPVTYQPRQISMNRLMAIPATAVAIGLIVVLGMTVQEAAGKISSEQTKLDANNALLEKRQTEKKQLSDNIAGLEGQVSSADASREKYTRAFDAMGKQGDKMNNDLQTTVFNIVADQTIEAISHNSNALTIAGTAVSEQQVFDYVRKMTATGRFKEITISSLALQPDGLIRYALGVRLKDDVY